MTGLSAPPVGAPRCSLVPRGWRDLTALTVLAICLSLLAGCTSKTQSGTVTTAIEQNSAESIQPTAILHPEDGTTVSLTYGIEQVPHNWPSEFLPVMPGAEMQQYMEMTDPDNPEVVFNVLVVISPHSVAETVSWYDQKLTHLTREDASELKWTSDPDEGRYEVTMYEYFDGKAAVTMVYASPRD